MPKLHVYKNEKETYHSFAGWLASLIADTLTRQDKFTIAITGGQVPRALYKLLASEYSTGIDWSKIHIYFGDEKCVVGSDNKTHSGVLVETLPLDARQVHGIKNDLQPAEAALQFEDSIRSSIHQANSSFDLVILTIDEKETPLLLLPKADESDGKERWVVPVYDKVEDVYKISLSVAGINAATAKAFLATGKNKQDFVQQILKGKYDPEKYPAQLILTLNKNVHWFLDEAAAVKLINSTF